MVMSQHKRAEPHAQVPGDPEVHDGAAPYTIGPASLPVVDRERVIGVLSQRVTIQ
jgi:hypothetical protein